MAGRKGYKNPKGISALVQQNIDLVLGLLAPSTMKMYNYVILEFKKFIMELDDGLNVLLLHMLTCLCAIFLTLVDLLPQLLLKFLQ